jgi:hypothetical protein
LKPIKNHDDLEEAITGNQNLAYTFVARGTKSKLDGNETTLIGQIDKPGQQEKHKKVNMKILFLIRLKII